MENKKVYQYKTPTKTIAIAIALGVLGVGALIFGIYKMNDPIVAGLKRGEVVEKRFEPFEHREQRISVGRDGFRQTISDGQYIIMVEVPRRGGHPFQVSLPDQETFDRINVGDMFDVGPYLLPRE